MCVGGVVGVCGCVCRCVVVCVCMRACMRARCVSVYVVWYGYDFVYMLRVCVFHAYRVRTTALLAPVAYRPALLRTYCNVAFRNALCDIDL